MNVEVVNELVPCFKASFPRRERCIATLVRLAWLAGRIHTRSIRYATQIAERERRACLAIPAKCTLMEEESQSKRGVDAILHAQGIEGRAFP